MALKRKRIVVILRMKYDEIVLIMINQKLIR